MEENNLIQKALDMHREGKSIRNIALILGTSKSNIHRWVHSDIHKRTVDKKELADDVPVEMGQNRTDVPSTKQNINPSNYTTMDRKNFQDEKLDRQIMLKRLEMEQQIRLRKEDREDEEISLRREQLRLERLKLDQPLQIKRQEEKSLHWDLIRFFKHELEIIEEYDNYIEISLEELTEKVKALRQMLEHIKKHCFKYDIDEEKLVYHSNIEQLYVHFKNLLEENEDLESTEESEIDSESDDEPDSVIIQYKYDRTSIQRIRMLTVAEFGVKINEIST